MSELLNPELAAYLVHNELGANIKHPLVFSIMHSEEFNHYVNQSLVAKKEVLKRALEEKDWDQAIFIFEKPYRLQKTVEYGHLMDEKSYWNCVRHSWLASENVFENKDILHKLFRLPTKTPLYDLMEQEDRETFEKFPETMYIYRGCQSINKHGWSWTTNFGKAKWFAKRWNLASQVLLKAKVNKEKVLAYLNGRSEDEIIVEPKNVKVVSSLHIIENIEKL